MQVTLRQGTVYYFHNDALKPEYPHYHIILNRDPLLNNGLHIAVCTSKVEALREKIRVGKIRSDTVIFVGVNEYKEFTKDSAIDCNRIVSCDVQDLKEKMDKNEVRYCTDFPRELLEKVIDGVLLSGSTDDIIRAAVLGTTVDDLPLQMVGRFGYKLKKFLPNKYNKEFDVHTTIINEHANDKCAIRIFVKPEDRARTS